MRKSTSTGLTLLVGSLAVAIAACGGNEEQAEPAVRLSEAAPPAETGASSTLELPPVTVYKSPVCGCCAKWVDHMRSAGFEVRVVDDEAALYEAKRRHAIGPGHTSCHTAEVGGYFVEGHVPAADVQRLLADAPSEIAGLAVPGMPVGSPGMEGPRKDDYDVVAIKPSGETYVYTSH